MIDAYTGMKLSNRLMTVVSFVRPGSRVADVGTDHGYVPIWLLDHGVAESAIAMDVRSGPLERAAKHRHRHKLEDKMELRLSDGLKELQAGEADTVIIAGMGGELMLRILAEGAHVWDRVTDWILSPQSEWDTFRYGLERMGFVIGRETMLCEDGKYYIVLLAGRGVMHYQREIDYRYGYDLLQQKSPVLLHYLNREKQQLLTIQEGLSQQDTPGARVRLAEVRQKLGYVKEALDAMQ